MKALTVQQPWAWAIVHGGKDVENRTQAWSYRGPLAIHAGARLSDRGLASPLVQEARVRVVPANPADRSHDFAFGAFIGVVDLVDVHTEHHGGLTEHGPDVSTCCVSEWAETSYAEHGGHIRRDVVHLVLASPRPLLEPIPCKGRLGLWTPPTDILEQLGAAL